MKEEKQEVFKSGAVRRAFRLHPDTVKKHLRILHKFGRLEVIGGSRYTGLEYGIKYQTEYEELQKDLERVMNRALEQIRVGAS